MIYKQGDVFLANLNPSKGKEPSKIRPVVILQTDALNEIPYPTCIIIPLSTKKLPHTDIRPELKEKFFHEKTFALIDQIRTIDVEKRLLKKIGKLTSNNLFMLKHGLISLIE